MSSVERYRSQIPVNALYTNIADVRSSIYTATGARAPWVAGTGAVPAMVSTASMALFRDMGNTVYLPNPTVGSTVGSQSTILRKVQLVTGFYGTGTNSTSGTGEASGYFTGYIPLGGMTYGGGTGVPSGFVRAN